MNFFFNRGNAAKSTASPVTARLVRRCSTRSSIRHANWPSRVVHARTHGPANILGREKSREPGWKFIAGLSLGPRRAEKTERSVNAATSLVTARQ